MTPYYKGSRELTLTSSTKIKDANDLYDAFGLHFRDVKKLIFDDVEFEFVDLSELPDPALRSGVEIIHFTDNFSEGTNFYILLCKLIVKSKLFTNLKEISMN